MAARSFSCGSSLSSRLSLQVPVRTAPADLVGEAADGPDCPGLCAAVTRRTIPRARARRIQKWRASNWLLSKFGYMDAHPGANALAKAHSHGAGALSDPDGALV